MTHVITLWGIHITSLATSVSTMCFLIEIMFILKAIKSHFKRSYDKQNLTLVVILFEIYETSQRRNGHLCKVLDFGILIVMLELILLA